jgi:transcriptional regulator with XRE-family HTH domain
LGDHIRKRRLDLGLRQKDLARLLKANVNTVTNWEVGRSTPALRHVPGIIRFLGYVPFSGGDTLPERLVAYRRIHGLSQKRLAAQLGVDPSTLARWENGTGYPNETNRRRIAGISGSRAARP